MRTYGKHLPLQVHRDVRRRQHQSADQRLRRRVDILVATPGRLLDHVQQKTVDLSHVEILVLDEADRMLDMGFIRDIRKILALLPKKRQNLLFSATFSDEIKQLADGLLNDPALIEVARRNATAELIEQTVYPVDRERKRELLAHLIKRQQLAPGAGVHAHQARRQPPGRTAGQGRHHRAGHPRQQEPGGAHPRARGLQDRQAAGAGGHRHRRARHRHQRLPHVVNYELPNVPEDYVHRIGRTGRAGAAGEAVSLVCVDEHKLLKDIERLIKRSLPRGTVAGFEPDLNARAQPIQQRSGPRPQGASRGNAPAQARSGRPAQAPSKPGKPAQPGNNTKRPATSQPGRAGNGKAAAPASPRAQRRPASRGDGM